MVQTTICRVSKAKKKKRQITIIFLSFFFFWVEKRRKRASFFLMSHRDLAELGFCAHLVSDKISFSWDSGFQRKHIKNIFVERHFQDNSGGV